MKGEIAAEEGMKVGTDITETGPVAIMAEDKGQKAGAGDTMMTREGTMLVGTAVETTEIIVGTGMKGEIAEIERIITGIGEIIVQIGETEAGGDMTEARVGGDMIEARVGGEATMTEMSNASNVVNLATLQFTARIFRPACSLGREPGKPVIWGIQEDPPMGYIWEKENYMNRQGFRPRERAQSLVNSPTGWAGAGHTQPP